MSNSAESSSRCSAILSHGLPSDRMRLAATLRPKLFVYYFIGSVISRVGSLFIEPLLKRTKFVTFAPYSDFVAAAKEDPKIEILSEQNNMYRTICAMLLLFGAVIAIDKFGKQCIWLEEWSGYLMLTALFTLYLFSYRKQCNYITNRVEVKKANSIVLK